MRTVSVGRRVTLDERQRQELQSFANSRRLPHGLVVRARVVLEAGSGAQKIQSLYRRISGTGH